MITSISIYWEFKKEMVGIERISYVGIQKQNILEIQKGLLIKSDIFFVVSLGTLKITRISTFCRLITM